MVSLYVERAQGYRDKVFLKLNAQTTPFLFIYACCALGITPTPQQVIGKIRNRLEQC